MLQRYLLLWLCLSSGLAYVWPELFPGLADPFTASLGLLTWLIVVTMFCIGIMLPVAEVNELARRWPMVLSGTVVQYTMMPVCAYVIARLGGFEGDHLLGLMLVGCVPGAMASNVLTMNAGGNTSYSVSLTTMATLLSPLIVPLALMLTASASVNIEFAPLSMKLLLTVVLPVSIGHVIGRIYPARHDQFRLVGSTLANLAILWIIAAVVGKQRDDLASIGFAIVVALLLINLSGYTGGYLAGRLMRLPEGMRRALTLEVGMQNAGLGAVLATTSFAERSEAAIAPALYTFGCMLTGTLLARAWAASDQATARRDRA